jgi:hypothetical protein
MRPVQDASLVIVEGTNEGTEPRVPVADVRNADEDEPVALENRSQLPHQSLRMGQMLEEVGGDDHVEFLADAVGQPVIQIGLME